MKINDEMFCTSLDFHYLCNRFSIVNPLVVPSCRA